MNLLRSVLISLFLLAIYGCSHHQPLQHDEKSDYLKKDSRSDITSYVVINYRQLKRESKTQPGRIYTNLAHLIAKAYALSPQTAQEIVHKLVLHTTTPAEFVNMLDKEITESRKH